MLIPHRIAEYEASADPLISSEQRIFRRALAALYFQMELYLFALVEIEEARDDPELAALRRVMGKIDQAEDRVLLSVSVLSDFPRMEFFDEIYYPTG